MDSDENFALGEDRFYNGDDGSRVTDEQWDVSRDREAESVSDLMRLGFASVGSRLPEGHSFAGAAK